MSRVNKQYITTKKGEKKENWSMFERAMFLPCMCIGRFMHFMRIGEQHKHWKQQCQCNEKLLTLKKNIWRILSGMAIKVASYKNYCQHSNWNKDFKDICKFYLNSVPFRIWPHKQWKSEEVSLNICPWKWILRVRVAARRFWSNISKYVDFIFFNRVLAGRGRYFWAIWTASV